MKTEKQILMEVIGIQKESSLDSFPEINQETCLEAMRRYAYQFMNVTKCYNCDGTGKVSNTTCIYCNGNGKVILMPTITTTGT